MSNLRFLKLVLSNESIQIFKHNDAEGNLAEFGKVKIDLINRLRKP